MRTLRPYLIAAALTLPIASMAQMASWCISPEYDKVELIGTDMYRTEKDGMTSLWTLKGKKIADMTGSKLMPFKDGVAVVVDATDPTLLKSVINSKGGTTDLSKYGYRINPDYPYYSDGYLLVQNQQDYIFINKEGQSTFGPFAMAYPFSDGVASVRAYEGADRDNKNLFWAYVSENFPSFPEDYKFDEIVFNSSFSGGKAVAVMGKDAYLLSIDSAMNITMRPIYFSETQDPKNLVTVNKKDLDGEWNNDVLTIQGKNSMLQFDKNLRPTAVKFMDAPNITFQSNDTSTEKLVTVLEPFTDKNDLKGIKMDGTTYLSGQFDDITSCLGNQAIVTTKNGEQGVVRIDKEGGIQLRLNNNENIGFSHRHAIVKLTGTFPSDINIDRAVLISCSPDCEILPETRKETKNIECNTLSYDCRLTIPENLSDTLQNHDYFYAVSYDGLTSVSHKVTVPEWYMQFYEIDFGKTAFKLNGQNSLNVDFELTKSDMAPNDGNNYFKSVELISEDSVAAPVLNKINENRYSFTLPIAGRDRAALAVRITEAGCPSIEYPFAINFSPYTNTSNVKMMNSGVAQNVRPAETQMPQPVAAPAPAPAPVQPQAQPVQTVQQPVAQPQTPVQAQPQTPQSAPAQLVNVEISTAS